MTIHIHPFGEGPEGPVSCCRMENDAGMSCEILDYGAIIRSLCLPDRKGEVADVVLGHDGMDGYLGPFPFSAAVIGRFANRIADGRFEVAGKSWDLEKNQGPHTLHGASNNYASKRFSMRAQVGEDIVQAILTHHDKGEAGFPGTVEVEVTYTLRQDNSLEIHYKAVPTTETPINLTNHVYFNLAGHGSGPCDAQELRMEADFYTPNAPDCVPTGEVSLVKGTAFDFRTFRSIGSGFASEDPQVKQFHGYDHNLCFRGRGYRRVVEARDPVSGRCMTVLTDLPGAQLYTANAPVPPEAVFKDGAHYQAHQAFCIETQFFPNGPNVSHFPSPFIHAGQVFETTTTFRFNNI